jgi:hypothetical protein
MRPVQPVWQSERTWPRLVGGGWPKTVLDPVEAERQPGSIPAYARNAHFILFIWVFELESHLRRDGCVGMNDSLFLAREIYLI